MLCLEMRVETSEEVEQWGRGRVRDCGANQAAFVIHDAMSHRQ